MKEYYFGRGRWYDADEVDKILAELKKIEPPKVKCATCDNNITKFRAMQLPICDECIKDLREIIKAHKEDN